MATDAPPPPPDRDDCYAPPAEPCECFCLHCQRVINSADMWLQAIVGSPDGFNGFWMCPTPNCGGAGFTFDIHPTDPDHPANAGWHSDDGEDDEEDAEIAALLASEDDDDDDEVEDGVDPAVEYDPSEPQYAAADDPDAMDGEEWKHGLSPGERPPESPQAAAARAEWEAEQRKYDEPDRRPRTIDGSHWQSRRSPPTRPGAEVGEDDIPF